MASENKMVIYKHIDLQLYPMLSYVCSVILVHVPFALCETLILGTLIYFISHFVYAAQNYFFFIFILFTFNILMSVLFRSIAYLMRNADIAQPLAGPITIIFFVLGGIFITMNKIPNFIIWLYWISPFSWAIRCLAQNEYLSSRYDTLSVIGDEINQQRIGDIYLQQYAISTNPLLQYIGIAILWGYIFIFVFGSAYVLQNRRFQLTMGTRRTVTQVDENAIKIEIKQTKENINSNDYHLLPEESITKSLPFISANLVFTNLHYSVPVTVDKVTFDKKLLSGINGYAKAGTLTALMGSSGAGKTTLMDVIAGRKTGGKIEGEILINGYKQDSATFNQIAAYVEQTDLHIGTSTVREALHFSAQLRLPSSVTADQRIAFVNEVLEILELTSIADRIIGDVNIPGLSPGELKRVTIGVELVANPSILFLDEVNITNINRLQLEYVH
jgi:energy-coupling factor transporter ATP-binding protein EcfA2